MSYHNQVTKVTYGSAGMTDHNQTARRSIIEACKRMNTLGLNQGTSGNISTRHGDGLLITPSGIAYDTLVPEDITHMRIDGSWTGPLKPSTEWRFHLAVMAARPEVNAVAHCHAQFSTTLAIMGRSIPAIHYMVAAAGGNSIPCAPYATFGTEKLSDFVVQALQGRSACLLAHHGMIAVGPSLDKALWLAVEVENLARQYHGCLQIGEPPVLPDAEMAVVLEKFKGYGLQEK